MHPTVGWLAVNVGDRAEDLAGALDAYLEDAALRSLDAEIAATIHAIGAVPTPANVAMIKRRILSKIADGR